MAFAPRLRMLVVTGYGLLAAVCHAQSFDCGKAQTAIEKAICASPALAAQDNALTASYRQAVTDLNGDAAKLSDLRAQQRRWLADRNKSCSDTDPARLPACLTTSYQARLTALQTAGVSTSQMPPASAQVVAPATSTAPETQPAAAKDTPAAPAKAASQPASVKTPVPPASQPHLASDKLPADQDGSTLLTVDTPGYFTMRT